MNLMKIFAVGMTCALFIGCGMKAENNVNNSTFSATDGVGGSNNATANLNQNSNTQAKEIAGPKRIAFSKGSTSGTVAITLEPGASQKFIIGAKSGQIMDVEASAKDVSINLIKGKAETTEDFGFLKAVLESNGDFVFEITNSSKKEVKTSVKVTIKGENKKVSESVESGSKATDDNTVLLDNEEN